MNWLIAFLWGISILIWIFSAGFDGRFIATLMPAGLLWQTFAYGLNFVADVSNEMFAYTFMRLQRENRRGSKVYKWSFVLLIAQAGALYFGTVFSQAAIAEARPDLAPHLQWSAALFAQFVLLFLGVAQALLAVKAPPAKSVPKADVSEPLTVDVFACPYCERTFTTQNGLNAHRGRCKAKGNGHKRTESETEPARSEQ